jgi:hypothetical protein
LIRDTERGGISVKCFAGCDGQQIRAELARRGLLTQTRTTAAKTVVMPKGDTVALARELWRQGRDASGTVVEHYLLSRGLVLEPEVAWYVKYHPSLWVTEERRTRPGMIVLLSDITTGDPTGIIRTFLNPEFLRADYVYDPRVKVGQRKMLGRAKHAAVKLGLMSRSGKLTVGEGYETCVSWWMTHRQPVWVLGSAEGIKWFPVIEDISELTILVDNDPTGRAAAQACADRWLAAGRRVLFQTSKFGKDFADQRTRKNNE